MSWAQEIIREALMNDTKLKARIAELERQLAESRDFAISEVAKIRAEYERQQGLLVARLRESNGILQAFKTQSQTATLQLIDNELTLEHIGLVRDSVKPAGQKGSE